ncbi:unnamed protein product [Vitrella brassicaformis CCMP3155]|uniref:PLOD1-3-like GT domain-containing protein n=3 Tax=Vitrella brassicaformis TaxID=1169539 RepID=A0A0G4EBL7_VITBC|nr:unnamed protein product [Vitrella brassicaformis CCMP3155]|eukprot:CEL93029.1 unnamed protein product [Vitrella brassicaformis CCMP3155]
MSRVFRHLFLFAAASLSVFLISFLVGLSVSRRGWLTSQLRGIVSCPSGTDAADQQQVALSSADGSLPPFVLVTVGQNQTNPGYRALSRSARYYGVDLVTIGQNEKKRKGDPRTIKLEVMRRWLSQQDPDLLVVFTDGYDGVLRVPNEELERRLRLLIPDNDNTTIIVSSELGLWPDRRLKDEYPMPPTKDAYRFLNSGGYAGRAGALSLCLEKYPSGQDDQLFFTRRFLKNDVGHGVTIKLDYERPLFQALTRMDPDEWKLAPTTYRSRDGERDVHGLTFARTDGKEAAALLHGNGHGKDLFYHLVLLEAGAWTNEEGSVWYERDTSPYQQPKMVLAVICAHPTGNSSWEFVEGLMAMEVDHGRTDLFVSSGPSCDLRLDENFKLRFAAVHEHRETSRGKEAHKRAFRIMRQVKASHLLLIENDFVVQQHDLVQQLVQDDLPSVVPLGVTDGDQANFGVDKACFRPNWREGMFKGSYHREDRDKLVTGERRGLWPVKCWSSSIMVRRDYKERDALRVMGVGDGWCGDGRSIFLDNRHRFGKMLSPAGEYSQKR